MVLGSGRTWPHDFRFLTGFASVACCGVDVELAIDEGVDDLSGEDWKSSILMMVVEVGSMVGGGVSWANMAGVRVDVKVVVEEDMTDKR